MDDIIKSVLCMYVILGYFIPLNTTLINIHKHVILGLLISIFIMFAYDFVYSILLIGCGIVFVNKLLSETQKNNKSSKLAVKDRFDSIPQRNNIKKTIGFKETNNKVIEKNVNDNNTSTNQVQNTKENTYSNYSDKIDSIQTNVFDKINYQLFYTELGDQHNIQGVETNISGYDKYDT